MPQTANDIAQSFRTSLEHADLATDPYPLWTLHNVLPEPVRQQVLDLPVDPPDVADTQGRRETYNAVRTFFAGDMLQQHPVTRDITEAFQDRDTVAAIETTCNVDLSNSYIRIEYAQDTGRFWLEPHTDIGAKRYSMLLYLHDEPDGESWGTDVYNDDRERVATMPFDANAAMVFIPSNHTWHGFERRTITGVRKSLIINYVIDEWRSRHELAYPDQLIR